MMRIERSSRPAARASLLPSVAAAVAAVITVVWAEQLLLGLVAVVCLVLGVPFEIRVGVTARLLPPEIFTVNYAAHRLWLWPPGVSVGGLFILLSSCLTAGWGLVSALRARHRWKPDDVAVDLAGDVELVLHAVSTRGRTVRGTLAKSRELTTAAGWLGGVVTSTLAQTTLFLVLLVLARLLLVDGSLKLFGLLLLGFNLLGNLPLG